ncbi:cell division protein FtsA [Candidatus Omnitrophota bacterium]
MREKTVCSIDIGDATVVAAIASVTRKGKISSIEFEQGKSRGVAKGMVSDIRVLSDCIQRVVKKLETKAKKKVTEVYVNVANSSCCIKRSHAVMPLAEKGSKVIRNDDMKKINRQARLLGLEIEEEVIHDFPQHYTVDGYGPRKNPFGLYGRKLEVELLMIIMKMSHKDNIAKALNHAGLEVKEMVFSSLATSLAVLDQNQKQKGCILLDIGATTTSFLVFQDGILQEVDIVPFGGNAITESIAAEAKIPLDLAEELKKSYALAFCEKIDEKDEILIKKSQAYLPIKRRLICEAAQAQLEQFIALMRDRIDAARKSAAQGIVIAGGASLMDGLAELIESRIHMPTKIGKVKGIFLSPSKVSLYSTALGLIHYAIDAHIIRKNILDVGRGYMKECVQRIKYLCQEYF